MLVNRGWRGRLVGEPFVVEVATTDEDEAGRRRSEEVLQVRKQTSEAKGAFLVRLQGAISALAHSGRLSSGSSRVSSLSSSSKTKVISGAGRLRWRRAIPAYGHRRAGCPQECGGKPARPSVGRRFAFRLANPVRDQAVDPARGLPDRGRSVTFVRDDMLSSRSSIRWRFWW